MALRIGLCRHLERACEDRRGRQDRQSPAPGRCRPGMIVCGIPVARQGFAVERIASEALARPLDPQDEVTRKGRSFSH